jgi:hypothetical protein
MQHAACWSCRVRCPGGRKDRLPCMHTLCIALPTCSIDEVNVAAFIRLRSYPEAWDPGSSAITATRKGGALQDSTTFCTIYLKLHWMWVGCSRCVVELFVAKGVCTPFRRAINLALDLWSYHRLPQTMLLNAGAQQWCAWWHEVCRRTPHPACTQLCDCMQLSPSRQQPLHFHRLLTVRVGLIACQEQSGRAAVQYRAKFVVVPKKSRFRITIRNMMHKQHGS